MNVYAQSIQREFLEMYADNRIYDIVKTNSYNIDFTIIVDGSHMKSNLRIGYDGDLSFDTAEKLIKNKFSDVNEE
ncbi:hypothetical protein [Virgibacillus pantothenticus]|uniref:Uncharacterized protein n=1 Tax=Virgibacillus pantothenticus TaxID=1473 RepID=A0A0L0QKA8_VIRPA|nr:hypothetical protein [Virgibacillus pantothenticus]KNE19050.1 hypothetical protein AFK71_10840 [Virgibacillus pantothenticus]MED3738969.1 hypothetical protein [Virgibacillus pantothenticus]QTY15491.1 hypothetical protein KBP50_16600 [Virgibacillus pantothenticus]SIT16636.1 hypothetical protein SAMN05421787_12717 [Virgibacillus pantothenticus]